ncbi:MAG: AAA family ATPase [Candidatus Hodarchaeota archaeon]
MDSIKIDDVEIFLSQPTSIEMEWIGQEMLLTQLMAAWAVIHEDDIPLCPRILGPPGAGKTTLAYAAAKRINKDVYIFQCTADTRPEDLIITPVISSNQQIKYHASPLVTAMVRGAICILDEGNRMPEKAWASLAPLLDKRRYAESIIAGVKIKAHPDFRICATMNQDASVFDIPDYIGSRLAPKIHVTWPERKEEIAVIKYNLPFAPNEIIEYVVDFLQKGHQNEEPYSIRDGINITRYMLKLSTHEQYPLSEEDMKEYFKSATSKVLDDEALDYLEGDVKKRKKKFLFMDGFGPIDLPMGTRLRWDDDGDDDDLDLDDIDDEEFDDD